jgi:hypothetical protein
VGLLGVRHPNDDELLAFLAGKLRLKRIAALHEHLDGCVACRALVLALARALPPAEPRPPKLELVRPSPP